MAEQPKPSSLDADGVPTQPSAWPSSGKRLENDAGSGHALDFRRPAEYRVVVQKFYPAHALMNRYWFFRNSAHSCALFSYQGKTN